MRIGMFTSGYQRNSLEDVFRDARRFGYDYIELWGGRPHGFCQDLKSGDVNEILRLIDAYEMPVLCYTPEHNAYPYNYMIGSEAQRQDAVAYLKTAMEMGKRMGAEFTLISTGHAGYQASKEEIWERLRRTLQELIHFGEQINHPLVLEALTPYESNVCTTVNDLQQVLNEIDSPYLGAVCDVVPPFVQWESIPSYIRKLGTKLWHLHLVDSDGFSDTHLIPGEGRIPIKELLEELKVCGYQGAATIELVTTYLGEPALYAKRAIEGIRSMMGR